VSGKSEVAGSKSGTPSRVRDRIFKTACELFYRHGIRAVGVDAIAARAGTNKMSFYRNFASKEDLVAQYLREQQRQAWVAWDTTVAPYPGDPLRQLGALFAAHLEVVKTKTCRGCALGNAAVELTGDDAQLRALVLEYKQEMRRRLRVLAQQLAVRDPDSLGDALLLLLDGSYASRLMFESTHGPADAMLPAVRALVDAYRI
jgi:AcrR family transcriptional regulator